MLESSFRNSLVEQGYADHTVRLKLQLLTNFGQWLRRKNLAVTNLDERLVDAFLTCKHRVHRADSIQNPFSSFSIICEGTTLFQLEI